MNHGHKIRLVLADDQSIIRQGLRYILNAQDDLEVVGEAANGQEALDVASKASPDIVLMDIQMPHCSGIEATRMIRDALPAVKVVLLTTFDIQDYVVDGIRAGAVGYLLKDTDTQELLDGIRWVYQGQAIYRTTTASKALEQVRASDRVVPYPLHTEGVEPLTDREIDVLQEMAYGHRNAEIADILCVSEGTVKTHVHRILQKLGVEDRTQAVVFAIRQGLVK